MTTASAALPIREQLSDEEIVDRIVAGDAALFEILMRRHNQRVYRAVRAVLGGDDEAEDVMQQAYLNAYRNLRQFSRRASFATWLTRIAVNEALGRRKRLNLVSGDSESMIELVVESGHDPEQQTAASELRGLLEKEIAALPAAFRTVIVLRDVEGLTTTEAAESLGISEDLVKQRLHRARTRLRDNLYKRAGVTIDSLFVFGNQRCDRVVQAVMAEIQ